MARKILITGGTGFIGSRLALHCIDRGDTVRVLAQANNPAEEDNRRLVEQRGVELLVGSVADRELVAKAVHGTDIVFHLAAAQHEFNVPDQHFWNVNVQGTKNLLEASLSTGVKRFVHGSTIGVYGAALDGELSEDSVSRPDNIYGVTKLEGERLVLSFRDRLPVAVARISETYGPGDRRLLKLFKAIEKNAFFMIGRGDNKHQLIYVDDLVNGLELLATTEGATGEIFVLAGGEVLTTKEMVEVVAKTLDAKLKGFHAPLWPFLLIAVVLEKALRPLGIQPPLHRRRMDFFRKSFFFSQAKASSVLGFKPSTDFAAGVAATANWYKEHGLL